jgi:predicted dehydrogenase
LHNYSYVPCIRNARHAIAGGKLGRVILAETRYFTSLQRERYYAADHWIHKLPGGVFSDILPHLLMLLLDFVGVVVAESKVLTMKRSDLSYVVADELKMTMTSASKVVGYVGLSFNSPVLYHTTDVICEQGVLFVDHVTGTVVYRKSPGLALTDREAGSAVSRGSWALQEILQKSAGFVTVAANTALGRYRLLAEGHRFLFEECFRALNSGSEYPVSLEKCREVVRLLESVSFNVGQTSANRNAK